MTRPALRRAPTNTALINRGQRRNPGWSKPTNVQHNAKCKAGKSGFAHRHRPFYFKHGSKRWRRHYYSYLVGGLWYWYDVVADTAPALPFTAMQNCRNATQRVTIASSLRQTSLVAPAILEGRATEEAMARCRSRVRSFDAEASTYVTYSGEIRICPYLE